MLVRLRLSREEAAIFWRYSAHLPAKILIVCSAHPLDQREHWRSDLNPDVISLPALRPSNERQSRIHETSARNMTT
ncbi:hypothetical protein PGTUg99_013368 [Puccinia graminis f. sp. tritici]|uniref:Uncharacterized protein n=1 Tax=Puccinia graminis f. sp. tritici TaxID=56615 RepID=A0A5B0SIB8_PUCGR|nr:hypothetical protein PGTUg99_013368 [Puccinia graminis f. sp. tritici]